MAICGISIKKNNFTWLRREKEAYSSWMVKQFLPGLALIVFVKRKSWREKSLAASLPPLKILLNGR